MTYQILGHAWRMIIRNINTVLQLALVPWLVVTFGEALVSYVFVGQLIVEPTATQPELVGDPNFMLVNAVFGLCAGLVTLWIIVGWHRFILLEEQPNGMFPQWRGKQVLSYLGHGILVGLACIVPLIGVVAVLGLVGVFRSPALMQGALVQGITVFVIMYFSLRVSLILPACAIEENLPMRESWQLTGTIQRTILGLAAIMALIALIPIMLFSILGTGVVMFVVYSVLSGVTSLFGVSILTTLYGILVEKRALT